MRRRPRATVALRDVTGADAALLYRWRMEASARAMFRHTEIVPFEAHQAMVARHLAGDRRDRWFVIEADGEPVGAVALYDFSPAGDRARWGRFVVDPGHRGRGVGGAALDLLTREARALGVEHLCCEVLEGNPAVRLYERAGFVTVGTEDVQGRRFLRMRRDLA